MIKPITTQKLSFDILDSIRGIAALYVVIAHCRGCLWLGGNEFLQMHPRSTWGIGDYMMFGTSMLTRLAVEFVIVFFVLSGFSIAHSLSSNHSPLQFYKRRLIRIYPSYITALIWAGVVFVVTRAWHPEWYDGSINQFAFIRTVEMNNYFDWQVIVKNLFYMPSHGFITPFWSLTYEVMFYLMAPYLLRNVNAYVLISAILFLFGFFGQSLIGSLHLPVYISDYLFTYNVYFAVGVFLYHHYQRISEWFTNYTKFEFTLIFIGLLGLMYGGNLYLQIENSFTFIAAAMLSVVLIVFFLKFNIRFKPLMGIGKFSYTMYITHFASVYLYLGIYWLIFKPKLIYITNFFVWIPAIFFCVGIAYLQYFLVEKRTKSILNLLRSKSVTQKNKKAAEVVPTSGLA